MSTVTSMTRNLQIDNMTGQACVEKVTGALKGGHGVTTHSVEVGHAKIGANQSACDAACTAVGTAGYPARELHAGEHAAVAKTSRPGVSPEAGTVPATDHMAVEPKADHKAAAAHGSTNKIEHHDKGGGGSGRNPMPGATPAPAPVPAPVPVASKPAVAAPGAPRGS